MKKQLVITALILVAALSACAGVTSGGPSSPASAVTPTTAPIASTPKSAEPTAGPAADVSRPAPSDLLINYERSGGIAGRKDILQVYADGSVVSTMNGKPATHAPSTPAIVSATIARIVDAGFFSLRDSYLPASKCCDLITYTLTLTHAGQTKTVTTMDGAQQPAALATALREVDSLMK